MVKIQTVLFDLDGTLIDTAPDMANALNILLTEEGYDTLAFDTIRPVVSNGSAALVQLGFPQLNDTLADQPEVERLKKRYLDIYQDKLCVDSVLFPGMERLLQYIEDQKMNWGVVTNKPGWLTEPLMQQIGLAQRAACMVSGDTTRHRKPHPEPMFLACKIANAKAQHCIYVGDARRDIEAGKHAGMQTVIAQYGYIGDWENTHDWGAHYSINAADELIPLLG